MKKGFLLVILSMSLWGLSYAMPTFLTAFNPFEIAIGRFIIYGLLSAVMLAVAIKRGKALPSLKEHWKPALAFACTGFTIYYGILVFAMQTLGAPLAALISGIQPIIISMYGNFKNKEFPAKIFIIPLLLILAGITIIHIKDVAESPTMNFSHSLIGLTTITIAILSWSWYAVTNGRFLKKNAHISPNNWSILVGLLCLPCSFIMAATLLYTSPESIHLLSSSISSIEIVTFIIVSLILGIGGSWLATLTWNKASLHVPMSLLGQMVVLEVFFGLFYIYCIKQSLPTIAELIGISFALTGVLVSIKQTNTFKKKQVKSLN